MTQVKRNPKVDQFIAEADQWGLAYRALRSIALDCQLREDFKWGVPCYTVEGGNVVLIHGFKEYCAFLFPKGVLLKDPKNLLIQQTKNTQSARQVRFASLQEINDLEPVLKDYIREAVEVEKAGLKVEFKETSQYEVPVEFQDKLDRMPDLKAAFEDLTPGRQRAYLLYFSSAKQSRTRAERVEKHIPRILEGKGLQDR